MAEGPAEGTERTVRERGEEPGNEVLQERKTREDILLKVWVN